MLVRLVETLEEREEFGDAIEFGRKLLALDELDEEAHRRLMRLSALSGRRVAALTQYRRCRQTLGRELGVEPSQETERLREEIERGVYRGARTTPFVVSRDFVGRDSEMDRLRRVVDEADQGVGRLVIVVGEAGSARPG